MSASEDGSTSRRFWVILLVALLAAVVSATVTAAVFLAVTPERDWMGELYGPVFAETVVGVSVVLGSPDSPATDLDWHEGTDYGGHCIWQRQATWPLGKADPESLVRRVESVVEPLTGGELLDGRRVNGNVDPWDLEGATTFYDFRYNTSKGSYETWLVGGVEDGGRFNLTVYGEAC